MTLSKAMSIFLGGYSTTIDKIKRKTAEAVNKILNASGSTDKFNKKLEATGVSANKASAGLGKYLSTTNLLKAAQKGMAISDEYINIGAKLDLINDGSQTQPELQEKIFASAKRSRGTYNDTASAVSKMGLLAGGTFNSNDELIGFTELIQKSIKTGGADQAEQSSALSQLTQIMAAGKLQGNEFESIMENAPMVAEAISLYTGKSKGELKEMSADGLITSEIIKNAMFSMSKEINTQFETMPKTFGDVWNEIQNGALKAFSPVIDSISSVLSLPEIAAFIEGFTNGLNLIAFALNIIISTIGEVISLISYFWPTIEPILVAIGAALLLWGVTQIPMLISKLWSMVPPILAQAAAWAMANMPILLIGAVIGLLLYAIIKFGDTVIEVIGVVGGIFGGLFAFIYNILLTFTNILFSFSEFFANVFNDPVYSIKKLFVDLATTVLNLVQSIAQAIDNVLGSKMADGLQNLKNTMNDWLGDKPENYREYTKNELMDITNSVNFGYGLGKALGSLAVDGVQDIAGKIGNMLNMTGEDISGANTSGANISGANIKVDDPLAVQGTRSNEAVKVDMADEDLQYLRDIAERDYIAKVANNTLAPQVKFVFGDIRETADVDAIKGRIEQIMREEIATSSEGVYA